MDPPSVDVSTLRDLYTTPPAQFVAARNQLVKERKAAKDREGATALGELRKPGLADWALNVVTTQHGDDVAAFLAAAAAVRDAQAAAIEGRDGPDIRAALRDLREHSGRVLAHAQDVLEGAGRDAAAEAGTVAGRLTEISANDEASAQLGAGVLGSSGVRVADLFAELAPAKAAAKTPRRAEKQPLTRAAAKKRPAVDAAELKERKQAVSRATRERDAAGRELARADTAVEKAAAAVRNAERQLEQAREAHRTAEQDQAAAASRLEGAEEDVRSAEQALERASA